MGRCRVKGHIICLWSEIPHPLCRAGNIVLPHPSCRYAFGITLWEMYTSRRAFHDVGRAHLGYQISQSGLRPEFPRGTPKAYADLSERCWEADPGQRCVSLINLRGVEILFL